MIEEKELVYICSPLSAPTKAQIRENMSLARFYVKMVASQFRAGQSHRTASCRSTWMTTSRRNGKSGRSLVCPFWNSARQWWCAEARISRGMLGEIRRAKELQIPVYALVIQENEISLTGFEEKEECHDM